MFLLTIHQGSTVCHSCLGPAMRGAQLSTANLLAASTTDRTEYVFIVITYISVKERLV